MVLGLRQGERYVIEERSNRKLGVQRMGRKRKSTATARCVVSRAKSVWQEEWYCISYRGIISNGLSSSSSSCRRRDIVFAGTELSSYRIIYRLIVSPIILGYRIERVVVIIVVIVVVTSSSSVSYWAIELFVSYYRLSYRLSYQGIVSNGSSSSSSSSSSKCCCCTEV
jgi:hypothetical protein